MSKIAIAGYLGGQGGHDGGNGSTTEHKGEYNSATTYKKGEQVGYHGSTYYLKVSTAKGIEPTNTAYWGLIASAGAGIAVQEEEPTDPNIVLWINPQDDDYGPIKALTDAEIEEILNE